MINLIGLSVGMTCAVLIFLWVTNEMTVDGYHSEAGNIYRITNSIQVNSAETWRWESSPMPMAEAAKREIPEVRSSARLLSMGTTAVKVNNKLFSEEKVAFVDNSWFDLFDYKFLSGDHFRSDPSGIILTESLARKYFGNIDAVGNSININERKYVVRGIIEDYQANSSFQYNILLPMDAHLSAAGAGANETSWGNFGYISFLQLAANADPGFITKKLNEILVRNKGDNSVVASLQPLRDMYFEEGLQSSEMVHGNKRITYIFTALAFLLILTACINYVNLTTAKASLRSKEVGVRKISGANRISLFGQFMMESLLISILALIVSLAFINLSLPVFNFLVGQDFSQPFQSANTWGVLLGTLLFTTILNGIYPAVLLSSFKPIHAFKGMAMSHLKDIYLRKGLVVFQFSLSVILIIATVIIFKQLDFLQHSNPGYNSSQVIALEVPFDDKNENLYKSFKNELKAQSSIGGVSITGSPVVDLNSSSSGNVDWDGRDTAFNPSLVPFNADADFKNVLDLQMKKGVWFSAGTDLPEYILNETAVSEFRIQEPLIGQRFSMDGIPGQIIGVVRDFHYKSLHEKIRPMVIRNAAEKGSFLHIKLNTHNTARALADVETSWKKFFPSQAFNYSFLDDTFNKTYKDDIKTSRVIFIFSIIVILISVLGLFGLATFTAQRRTKEIGVRKVLGASVTNIIIMLSREFIKLILLSVIIACPIVWYFANEWLQNFAYRIEIHWWIFVLSAITAIGIAFITVIYHAIKAARSNPVENLRTE